MRVSFSYGIVLNAKYRKFVWGATKAKQHDLAKLVSLIISKAADVPKITLKSVKLFFVFVFVFLQVFKR